MKLFGYTHYMCFITWIGISARKLFQFAHIFSSHSVSLAFDLIAKRATGVEKPLVLQ